MLALRVRVRDTVETAKGRYDFGRVVTQSPAMREVLEMARRAAESDHTTILIQGESGTGKEVLAKAIHYNSSRAQAPMIRLNCAALPDTLLESELFGYEPGAFTDARRRKEGLIEKASGGTLFLDEIGNTSASLQAKLLRVLEEGNFNRLGGTKPIQVDVRIIAATNKILKEAVTNGEFREDLYYRLNVVPLFIPPLRERREDILPLALDIMQFFNKELKKSFVGFTPAAAELLQRYPWPGNIRELRNVIERTMILSRENADRRGRPAGRGARLPRRAGAGREAVVVRRFADRRSVRTAKGTGRPLYPRSAERDGAKQNPRCAYSRHPSHLAAETAEEESRSGVVKAQVSVQSRDAKLEYRT